MKAVFDTNILIDYLNGYREAADELSRYEARLISIITYIEVLVGAKNAEEEQVLRGFLGSFALRELSSDVADVSVKLRQDHRLKISDAIVYASARVEGCLLVTRNTKDFRGEWPDVRVPYSLG
ncbi:MAG: PilT protein domain protein [Puniceicoccaceae bacterium 5H]|nr:MAG: PilT protein domain protein [Puniceicoccaceae bacterium 5H]